MKFAFYGQSICPGFVPSIHVLSEVVANQIAAGEVIERPANVVKELLENSLDAGAKHIYIQFFNGGLPLIQISDDGCGMDEEDATLCFKRHATGKLTRLDDLQTLTSFGFRGEALPSIASVAEVILRTRRAENELGCEVKISTTASSACVPCTCPVGTDITVERLFYNVPVRRKFLKSEATESAHIVHCVRLYALAYPQVHFELKQDGRLIFSSPQSETFGDRINALWPKRASLQWLPLQTSQNAWKLSGVISPPRFGQATAQMLYCFLNQRPITHPNLVRALREAYRGFLPDKQYPSAFLFLEMPGTDVDINVHPTKREVRFKQDTKVCAFICEAVRKCLKDVCRQPFGIAHDAPFSFKNIFPVAAASSFCTCKNKTFTTKFPENTLQNSYTLEPNAVAKHQSLPTEENKTFLQQNAENPKDIRNLSRKSDANASKLNADVPCSETAKGEKNGGDFENNAAGGCKPSKLSENSENVSNDNAAIRSSLGLSDEASSQSNSNEARLTETVPNAGNGKIAEDDTTYRFLNRSLDAEKQPNISGNQENALPFLQNTSSADIGSAVLSSNSESISNDKGNFSCISKALSTTDNSESTHEVSKLSEAVIDTKLLKLEADIHNFNPPQSSDAETSSNASETHPAHPHFSQKTSNAGSCRSDITASLPAETISENTSTDTGNTETLHGTFDIPFFALWQNRWAFFNNASYLLVLDCKGAQLRLWYDRIFSLLKQEQIGPLQTLLFPHTFSLEDRQAAFFAESLDWLKLRSICIAHALSDTRFQLEALPQWVPSEQVDLFVEQIAASLEYGGQMITLRYRFEPLLVRLAQRHRFEPMQNEKQIRTLCRELQTCENYITDPLGHHIWNRLDADDLMGRRLS